MRFELTTPTLARLCSTPELRPHPWKTIKFQSLRLYKAFEQNVYLNLGIGFSRVHCDTSVTELESTTAAGSPKNLEFL